MNDSTAVEIILRFIEHNLGTCLAVLIPTVMSCVKFTPLKIDVWKTLMDKLASALNKATLKSIADMKAAIDERLDILSNKVQETDSKLDEHIRIDDERDAKQYRVRILHFDDEILRGKKHSKEHFQEIMRDITDYEAYCESHRGYKNSLADVAIGHIKQIYLKYPDERYFMKV